MKIYSIIIPYTNSPKLEEIIETLLPQVNRIPGGEILIIGNHDKNILYKQSNLFVIPTTPQKSYASDKRNLGMKIAKGDIYLFLDDDCIPASDWLSLHLEAHGKGHKIVGGSVTFSKNKYLQLADNVSAFHDLLIFTPRGFRPYLSTSNLSVEKSVVDKAGFMEDSKNRAEDLEWTVRFRSVGYKLFFDPDIVIHHDPERNSISALWHHWSIDAPHTLRIRLSYENLLKTPPIAKFRPIFFWGSPIIALWASFRTFNNPKSLVLYWHTIPIVFLTKLVWCLSAYKNFPKEELIIL